MNSAKSLTFGTKDRFTRKAVSQQQWAVSEESFDIRIASYPLEKKIDISSYFRQNKYNFFVLEDAWQRTVDESNNSSMKDTSLMSIDEIAFQQSSGGNKRGIRGRACGAWQPSSGGGSAVSNGDTLQTKCVFILTFYLPDSKKKKPIEKFVEDNYLVSPARSSLSCSITESKTNTSFSLAFKGECHGVSKTDLSDMFCALDLNSISSGSTQQYLNFPCVKRIPDNKVQSRGQPLFVDAPEGARLITVLASTRRKENLIRLNNGKDGDEGSADKFVDVVLPKNLSINGNKWRKKDGRGTVYVTENCVPAAALPINLDLELFGCCANTLELRGGTCRVEGLTLLPPGRMFLGLAMLAFGVNPMTGSSRVLDVTVPDEEEDDEASEYAEEFVTAIVENSLSWITERRFYGLSDQWRTLEALRFHSECLNVGDALECQPELIKKLCALFDMVDGHPMTIWDIEKMATLRAKSRARKNSREIPVADRYKQRQANTTQPKGRDDARPMIPSKLITSKTANKSTSTANTTKYRKQNKK